MKMNRSLFCLLATLCLFVSNCPTAFAEQKPFVREVGGTKVQVEFYTPSIVRVLKTPVGTELQKKSLVVIAQPEDLQLSSTSNSVSSKELTVKVEPKTGALTFLSAKGKVLLREKDCETSKARQTFTLDKDEAIYGLGTIQNGKMNRRGERKRMEQSNLEDFQNVLQSIKGWGLYWDNYAPTLFEDNLDGMTFNSEAGESIDYYFMYGGSADGVIAQMRHLSGDVPMFPCGLSVIGNRRNATRRQPRRRASSISIANSECPSTASSKTGSTGAATICGTRWTLRPRTSPAASSSSIMSTRSMPTS